MALTKVTGLGLGTLDDNITFSTASKGIHLGVTSATASNLLDDYEEGTWTPTVGGNASYTSQVGFYTKIGNMVHVTAQIVIDAIGTGNASRVQGFPFTAADLGMLQGTASVAYYSGIATSLVWVSGYIGQNKDYSEFSGNSASATTIGHNTQNMFQNSTRIDFNMTYRAA